METGQHEWQQQRRGGACSTVIGQPCGGGIFGGYTTDSTSSALYYLIVAPSPLLEGYVAWSGSANNIAGAENTQDGSLNTDNIIASDGTDTAAGKCRALTIGGYTDWYLPAIGEMDLLHNNAAAIGVFVSAWSWSSTQLSGDPSKAKARYLTSTSTSAYSKTSNYTAHCVRRMLQ